MRTLMKQTSGKVMASMLVPGLGQLCNRQWGKGLLYLGVWAGYLTYLISIGARDLFGFFTLGSVATNPWYGIQGDNSVIMLLLGVLAWTMTGLYVAVYLASIKDAYATSLRVAAGKPPKTFRQELAELLDGRFYQAVLFLPIVGVCVFNILPVAFMILVAFTNYGGEIVPPALVDWVGFANFGKLLALGEFAPTFLKILSWNTLWAILSTSLNYLGGLALALLLNKRCVRPKVFWRAFPVLAYAIPGFITLLAFKFLFSYGGPINYYLTQAGKQAIGFLDLDAKWTARILGLGVNAWISVPSSMLLATGILSNMRQEQYEAARLDGASAFQQFMRLTLPFVVFATTPVLISQFIGNFNNFGIFYFLRGGLYLDGYFLASDTDLLINWLYNLSIDNNYYAIGAAISLVIFLITSGISLAVYVLSPAYRQEETYR